MVMRNRHSIRLSGETYTQGGIFFITICTHERSPLFGMIRDGTMRLNETGRIAEQCWANIPLHFPYIELDAFIVMPDHIHGILIQRRGTACRAHNQKPLVYQHEKFGQPVSGSIPTLVRSYKSAVTRLVNEKRNTPGMALWQRNYWEHRVRNKKDLLAIRLYIDDNPNHDHDQ